LIRKTVIHTAVIGCAALILGLAVNRRPGGIGWPALCESLPWETKPVERIDVDSAYSIKDSVRFWDIRPVKEYQVDRIPGAYGLDFSELAGGRFDPGTPKSSRLILYCFEPDCPRIELACRILIREGYRATILDEGFAGWIERGLPLEKGDRP
jgi:rhodanese-related sulfurtransferase